MTASKRVVGGYSTVAFSVIVAEASTVNEAASRISTKIWQLVVPTASLVRLRCQSRVVPRLSQLPAVPLLSVPDSTVALASKADALPRRSHSLLMFVVPAPRNSTAWPVLLRR